MEAFNYKGKPQQFGDLWTDLCGLGVMIYNDHLVGANELAGDEQADGYSSTCEEQGTQPGMVCAHISLPICDTNWLWKCTTCAAPELSSGFVCSLLCGDGWGKHSLPKNSFRWSAGSFRCQLWMSRLSQWQCCVRPREMGLLLDSGAPEHTHWRVLTTVVLSGNGKDLPFPMQAPCLFFT